MLAMAACRGIAALLRCGFRSSSVSHSVLRNTAKWRSAPMLNLPSWFGRRTLFENAPYETDVAGLIVRSASSLTTPGVAADATLDSEEQKARTQVKWPSPSRTGIIDQANKVYLAGIGLDADIVSLKKVLSQFGEVLDVNIPLLNRYRANPTRFTHRYGFAVFADSSGKSRALNAKSVVCGPDQKVDISDVTPKSQKPSSKTLFVEGFPKTLSEEELCKYFSNFGKVLTASKVNMRSKVVAFIDFESLEGATTALQKQPHTLAEHPLKVAASTSGGSYNAQQVIMADNLPADITVDQVCQYFSKFGMVKRVNLVLHGLRDFKPRNYAFVMFDSASDISKLIDMTGHDISGHEIAIRKSFRSSQSPTRASKVFVDGLPESVTEDNLVQHFNQIAPVKHVIVLKEAATGKKYGTAVVEFNDAASATKVADKAKQSIGGTDVCVRRLGFAVL